ncbi:MAG: DnaJ domain-containing protein [Spirochaetales bacterium]|nr:DnaJ domain-containing protein [Spirochaetales bacterium]
MVVDKFYRILGLEPTVSLEVVKDAYYRAAKKNHPDLFPEEQRHVQQLRMMKINEAYLTIVSHSPEGVRRRGGYDAGGFGEGYATASADAGGAHATGSAATGEVSRFTRDPGTAVGMLKDPAYAYYKRGFYFYSTGRKTFFDRYKPLKDRFHYMVNNQEILHLALSCLKLYEKSYRYFLKVAEDYPDSIWYRDTLAKMYYLERYNAIYHRICTSIADQLEARKREKERGAAERNAAG